MAPNRENIIGNGYSKSNNVVVQKPRISMESLQRTKSDITFELISKEALDIDDDHDESKALPPISEVEDAKCECCGMSEECTAEYINRVRDKFSGKMICGLCAEAVKEEMEKNGGKREEALDEHMSACVRFNRFGRTHPVLYQAEAMREILKKSSTIRAKSMSPRDKLQAVPKKGGIARSSSCIPAITKDLSDMKIANS
ncbi:hypothetical protein ACOSP7_008352 [Xanthoceras sorbifolium]|uniref:DUF1677 family protein n=1 Tax=Xanthoceras sorbifolium TaxID=99658 RepID=A0ABQ8ICA3_9ROSI|nr:hypothetical protein JRO89_XS03G0275000 [Xanthoceras sorbifolium]